MTDVHSHERISRLTRDEAIAAADEIGVPHYLCDLNLFRVLFRHPPLAKAINDFLGKLMLQGVLDDRLRELIIMRVAWQTRSGYEWAQHWRVAPRFGVSEDDLFGVRDWENHEPFGPTERAVLAATDEALADGAVTAATWEQCEANVGGVDALLELITVVGSWQMISKILRTIEIPLEESFEPWPPDGVSPA